MTRQVQAVARWAALLVVAVLGYSHAWSDAPVIEGDSPQYMEVARDLADGSLDTLHDRAPGYPLLLVLTRSETTPHRSLLVISLGVHVLSVCFLAAALRESGVSRRGSLAFLAVAMLPPYVEPAAHVMTENLAQFTLAAGLAALVFWWSRQRAWQLGAASLAFAYAALTRPTYQAVAIAIGFTLVALSMRSGEPRLPLRRAVNAAGVLIASSVLLLVTFAAVQHARVGFFGLVPTAGFHLGTKVMTLFERLPDEHATAREILVRERDRQLTRRGGTHTATQTVWEARAELAAAMGMSTPELSRYLMRLNLILIRKAPLEYLEEVARSIATYWFPAAGQLASFNSSALRWIWSLIHFAVIGGVFLQWTALTGWLAARGTLREQLPQVNATDLQVVAFSIGTVVVIYTMILSCFFDIGEVRQRRPTDVIILFVCVLGASIWCATARRCGAAKTT